MLHIIPSLLLFLLVNAVGANSVERHRIGAHPSHNGAGGVEQQQSVLLLFDQLLYASGVRHCPFTQQGMDGWREWAEEKKRRDPFDTTVAAAAADAHDGCIYRSGKWHTLRDRELGHMRESAPNDGANMFRMSRERIVAYNRYRMEECIEHANGLKALEQELTQNEQIQHCASLKQQIHAWNTMEVHAHFHQVLEAAENAIQTELGDGIPNEDELRVRERARKRLYLLWIMSEAYRMGGKKWHVTQYAAEDNELHLQQIWLRRHIEAMLDEWFLSPTHAVDEEAEQNEEFYEEDEEDDSVQQFQKHTVRAYQQRYLDEFKPAQWHLNMKL